MYIEENGGTLGGIPVEVIFEDTETQAEMVVVKTKKLIDSDKVHLLSGGMLAFENIAMVDAITKAKIAMVGHTGTANEELARLKSPYISGAAKHTPGAETMPFGDYAYNVLGYRTMAIIGQDYAWGWQTTGGFQFAFERAGGKIVQKLWAPIGTTDYAPFVTQLRRDVDAIYGTLVGADVPRFVKAYQDFGLKAAGIPFLGSEDFVAEDAYRYYGDEAIGIVGITPYTPNLDRPELQKFIAAYQKISGGPKPTFWSESSYEAAMAIDRALWQLRDEGVPAHELPEFVRNNAARFIATIRGIDLSDAPASAVTVDDYNWGIRDFYVVELVKKDGEIVDQVIDTIPEVGQFWGIDDPIAHLANPLFSREFPPVIHE